MPASVKTPSDEAAWKRARSIVDQQYPDKIQSDEDGYWRLVMSIYGKLAESEDMKWLALAEIVAPVVRGGRGKVVPPEKLEQGDIVMVTTKRGKAMISGSFVLYAAGEVTIRSEYDRLRTFPPELYDFALLQAAKESGEPVAESEGPDKGPDADVGYSPSDRFFRKPQADMNMLGPFPILHSGVDDEGYWQVKRIAQIVGDRWAASAIWQDIQLMGEVRAMERNMLSYDMMSRIVLATTGGSQGVEP